MTIDSSHIIMGLFFQIIAAFIYWDATANKIGRIRGEKGLLNMSAGWWAFGTEFLTFLAIFPILYFFNRKKLIAKAKDHPVSLTMWHRIFVMALVVCLPTVLGILLGNSAPHLFF